MRLGGGERPTDSPPRPPPLPSHHNSLLSRQVPPSLFLPHFAPTPPGPSLPFPSFSHFRPSIPLSLPIPFVPLPSASSLPSSYSLTRPLSISVLSLLLVNIHLSCPFLSQTPVLPYYFPLILFPSFTPRLPFPLSPPSSLITFSSLLEVLMLALQRHYAERRPRQVVMEPAAGRVRRRFEVRSW